MARTPALGLALAACAALALALASSPARADGHMTLQAGVFAPFSGDPGYSLLLQMLGSNASGKARFGGEIEYRNFDSTIIDVRDVEVESYILRAVWQQHFVPDGPITPYIGIGLGLAINDVNDAKVDRVRGRNSRGHIGAGPDGVFMLGVQARIPDVDYMSIYAEGRVGFSYDLTGRKDTTRVEIENLGGASGNAGIRFRF